MHRLSRAGWLKRSAMVVLLTFAASLSAVPAQADLSDDIRIISSSDINLLARESRLPITIQNDWNYPITLTVHGFSSSFRLEVLNRVEVQIPPGESIVAELPVRAIANGEVDLRVWLSVNGMRLGNDTELRVNVNPDVELFLIIGFLVLLSGLGVAGAVRTRLKLRRDQYLG